MRGKRRELVSHKAVDVRDELRQDIDSFDVRRHLRNAAFKKLPGVVANRLKSAFHTDRAGLCEAELHAVVGSRVV
jgi:hypothetical protein